MKGSPPDTQRGGFEPRHGDRKQQSARVGVTRDGIQDTREALGTTSGSLDLTP